MFIIPFFFGVTAEVAVIVLHFEDAEKWPTTDLDIEVCDSRMRLFRQNGDESGRVGGGFTHRIE
jgi:hypothetical protein